MKAQPINPPHDLARALFGLRNNLRAARAVLDDDTVVERPLPILAISQTQYRDDALFVWKRRALKLVQDALVSACHLMDLSGSRQGTELGSLATQIQENIDVVLMCLGQPLDSTRDEDRLAARRAIERPWQLSGIAIRCFFSTEPAFSLLGNGAQARAANLEQLTNENNSTSHAFCETQMKKEKCNDDRQ